MRNIREAVCALVTLGVFAVGTPADAATRCVGGGGCFGSIQAAIDASGPGDLIKVYPGNYSETAVNRFVLGTNGPHQFGLFIDQAHHDLTIQGVDAAGKPIRDFHKVKAFITTNSTANFGPSGIFVEGDGVTIAGLSIGVNNFGQNKTIEVIGDRFELEDCDVNDPQGSVYLNDWQFDTINNLSHLRKYSIERNNFRDGVSLDLASGAGFSGSVWGRLIVGNSFTNQYYWPSISFNGSDTGVPWFVYSVGGAIIIGNSFVNTFVPDGDPLHLQTEGHIRARGTYDNHEFDWTAYFFLNGFDKAYATGPLPPFVLRQYSYTSSPYTFDHVRRIGALAAGEQAIAQPGDKTISRP